MFLPLHVIGQPCALADPLLQSTKGEYTGEYEGDFKQSGGRVVNETPEPAAALTKKEAKQEKKAAKKAAKKKSYRNLQRV